MEKQKKSDFSQKNNKTHNKTKLKKQKTFGLEKKHLIWKEVVVY